MKKASFLNVPARSTFVRPSLKSNLSISDASSVNQENDEFEIWNEEESNLRGLHDKINATDNKSIVKYLIY
jgi:hypothetical protein